MWLALAPNILNAKNIERWKTGPWGTRTNTGFPYWKILASLFMAYEASDTRQSDQTWSGKRFPWKLWSIPFVSTMGRRRNRISSRRPRMLRAECPFWTASWINWFTPQRNLKPGLRKTLDWYQEKYANSWYCAFFPIFTRNHLIWCDIEHLKEMEIDRYLFLGGCVGYLPVGTKCWTG
jgi:hypothetical protein